MKTIMRYVVGAPEPAAALAVDDDMKHATGRSSPSWREALSRGIWSGTLASVSSAIALAACGKLERNTAAGPVNGPSQWIWGREAAYRRDASARHTLVGYAVHHLSATFWAVLHEKFLGARADNRRARHVAAAATTASVACFADYRLTPLRLRPGFEVQLSRKSIAVVYAAFALGLALGSFQTAARRRPR